MAESGPAYEGSPLLAAARKASEPATPSEGEVTAGEVGVGKRQTFKYAGTGGATQEPVLTHGLETEQVSTTAFTEEGAHWATTPINGTTTAANKIRIEATPIKNLAKGKTVIFVLTA